MLPLHVADLSKKKRSLFSSGYHKIAGWLRFILADKTSRNIFMFLLINLSFAFVELFYGIWSNCLGLISDSFHMFFDCTALLAGLIATIISKWRPNDRFSFGYVRIEVMAGFVNGLFLLFIAFFIFSEAVERFFEPPEVRHERLLFISVGGFLVNMIGVFVFHHGHAHSHGGHGHSHGGDMAHTKHEKHGRNHVFGYGKSHDHGGHSHGHSHDHSHGHSHDHGHDEHSHSSSHGHVHSGSHEEEHSHNHSHGHDHSDGHSHGHHHGAGIDTIDTTSSVAQEAAREGGKYQILQGVFLHVLADTLGSVGVMISSFLIDRFGCMVADPICSMVISALIFVSVFPLIRSSTFILMQRSPEELDNHLPACYEEVTQLHGVYSIQEPHFWTLCSEFHVGALRVVIAPNADAEKILHYVRSIFTRAGVTQVTVQIERSQL
ncbi:zinc transporter 7-like [Corticium candelabrum]|uniref:zinc transporter 7-like n=1 Tax=Corticium candelabrum TaxID=121492 RepID=UPI002E266CCE|nr:zinc transporter 7-like [Corticium candelabrum]